MPLHLCTPQATVENECAAGKLVVVNFFAPECYACKSMQPKLRQIARDNPDAMFLKVNGLVSVPLLLGWLVFWHLSWQGSWCSTLMCRGVLTWLAD